MQADSIRPRSNKKGSRDPAWWQPGDQKWYMQRAAQTAGPWYFRPQAKLKNGGLKGLMVDVSFDKRAKQKSLTKMDFRLWSEVPESEVPAKVRSMIESARSASQALEKSFAALQRIFAQEIP